MLFEVPPILLNPATDARILVGFGTIVTSLVLWGLHGSMPAFVRTLLDMFTHRRPGENVIVSAALAPERLIVRGVRHMFHRHRHHVSHAVQLNSRPLQGWLDATGNLWSEHTGAVAAGFEATATAVTHLRHVTVPRLIRVQVAPVRHTANQALRVGDRSISLGRKNERNIGHGIDRLKRRGRWPLAAGLLGIDAGLELNRRHERANTKDLHNIKTHTLPRHAHRLKDLERTRVDRRSHVWKKVAALATAAGLTAAVTRVLFRKWPWMGCRNFGRMSKLLRCSHFGLIADLLAYGLALIAVVDPVAIGKAAILSEEAMGAIVKRIAELNPDA